MWKAELWYAVEGTRIVSSVSVDLRGSVKKLREMIASAHGWSKDASLLTLYLAEQKENGAWLQDDNSLMKVFQAGGTSNKFEEMRPSWRLNDSNYFGSSFYPEEKQIHILVTRNAPSEPRSQPVGNEGVLCMTENDQLQKFITPFRETSETLKGTAEVRQLVQAIECVHGKKFAPFIILESSGKYYRRRSRYCDQIKCLVRSKPRVM